MKTEDMAAEGDLGGHDVFLQTDRAIHLVPAAVEHFAHPRPVPQLAHIELMAGRIWRQILHIHHHPQTRQEVLFAVALVVFGLTAAGSTWQIAWVDDIVGDLGAEPQLYVGHIGSLLGVFLLSFQIDLVIGVGGT